jgi:colicin import membrane protein
MEPEDASAGSSPKPWFKRKRIWLLAAIGLFVVGIIAAPSDETESDRDVLTQDDGSTSQDNAAEQPAAVEEESASDEADSETVSQRNARRSAESYLRTMAFSRDGLIKQLKFEGYDEADATYGVDALIVDWKDQAAKSAATYLDTMPFSRQGLIDQLLFEGFTREQAEFGVDAVGL